MAIPFEIHITGEESILSELTELGLKNISVELLRPNKDIIRIEHMSSFTINLDYKDIHDYVKSLISILKSHIFRIKVECPPIKDLFPLSLYIESHFEPLEGITKYPLSRNLSSRNLMATDREYSKKEYENFLEYWKNEVCELCILDTFKEEDFDWFQLYEK